MRRMGFWGRVRYVWDAIRVAFGRPRGAISSVTSFRRLPGGPPQDVLERAMRRLPLSPPDDELGVAVDLRRVLVSTPEIAIAVTGCAAYSTGFELQVAIRRKEEPAWHGPPPRHPPPEIRLRLGITFADGRRSAGSGGAPPPEMLGYHQAVLARGEAAVPAGPVIGQTSGGGGGRRWNMNYWVWPLPPDGPLTVTCEWPEGGVDHAEAAVDGAAIRRAGESSPKLWAG